MNPHNPYDENAESFGRGPSCDSLVDGALECITRATDQEAHCIMGTAGKQGIGVNRVRRLTEAECILGPAGEGGGQRGSREQMKRRRLGRQTELLWVGWSGSESELDSSPDWERSLGRRGPARDRLSRTRWSGKSKPPDTLRNAEILSRERESPTRNAVDFHSGSEQFSVIS